MIDNNIIKEYFKKYNQIKNTEENIRETIHTIMNEYVEDKDAISVDFSYSFNDDDGDSIHICVDNPSISLDSINHLVEVIGGDCEIELRVTGIFNIYLKY